MKNFARIFRFAWPHRRQLATSVLFAVLVAMLWSLTLLLAFPVMKVLLQGQHLAGYVEEAIADAETELAAGSNNDMLNAPTWKLRVLYRVQSHIVPLIPEDQFDTLALILGVLVLATVLKGVFRFIQETLVASFVQLTIMGMRKECFRRTLALDYQTLAVEGTPALMSRFTYDMSLVADGLMLMGVKVIREPLKAVACLTCAFFVNWRLTLLSLLCVPLAGLVFHRFGRVLKRASHRLMESMSRIYKMLEESLDGIKVLIAFDAARRHRRRFHKENKEYYSKAMTIARMDALASPTMEILGMLAICLGLLPGAYLVLRETKKFWGVQLTATPMEIAQLAVMYTLLAGMIDPVRKLSSIYSRLKQADVATGRIFQLMESEPLVKQRPKPKPLPRHAESVEFDCVTFSYLGRDDQQAARPAALDEVSLKVAFGEVVAVVGENGSGKSTLLNLIPRFCDPDRGTVRIDGLDVRDVRMRDLRNQIGIVTQETMLFDDTIFENIRYGKADASWQEVEEAARKADLLSIVRDLPEGFQTRVGEKGQSLSGGQRQRLALARAILRDPSILILDEPTSAIDAQSEAVLHQVLRSFVKGRTTFLITHTVSSALLEIISRIVVMDRGRQIAVGDHETLLATCPVYQRLFQERGRQRAA